MPPPSRPEKRKRAKTRDAQRLVAQRLLQCAAASDASDVVRFKMERQRERYTQIHAQFQALKRLQLAAEQIARFQASWHVQDGPASSDKRAYKLRKKLHRLVSKVAGRGAAQERLELVHRRLPRLLKRAERILAQQEQQQQEQEQQQEQQQDLEPEQSDHDTALAPQLTHQWMPSVLWRLHDGAVSAAARDKEAVSLQTAMQEVLAWVRDEDPFFFLQVLYRPPPSHLAQQGAQWQVNSSESLTKITSAMTPFFRELSRRAHPLMNRKDADKRVQQGWNKLQGTLALAQRAARAFHVVVLHLYAVAMDRAPPDEDARGITDRVLHDVQRSGDLLQERLRLSKTMVDASENLVKETYEWTPELLVYLDAWRRRRRSFQDDESVLGFERGEKVVDFLPQFVFKKGPKSKAQQARKKDVLKEIGMQFQAANHAWRASKLGTPEFKSMRIEDVGALEVQLKGCLSAVVDMVYQMTLARWMSRRQWPMEWWDSLQLRQNVSPESLPSPAVELEEQQEKGVELPVESSLDTAKRLPTDAEATERSLGEGKEGNSSAVQEEEVVDKSRMRPCPPSPTGFRAPTTMTLSFRSATAKRKMPSGDTRTSPAPLVPRRPAREQPIELSEIYAWTDAEIDDYERETERILEARSALLELRERLTWAKALVEVSAKAKTGSAAVSDSSDKDWVLFGVSSHLCEMSETVVALAEEIAMHGAADALIQRPELRIDVSAGASEPLKSEIKSESGDRPLVVSGATHAALRQLQKLVHDAQTDVQTMLDKYDGTQPDEWRQRVLLVGQASLKLLRVIADDALRVQDAQPANEQE